MSTIIKSKPQVEVDAAIRELLQVQEEKCTIVHCKHHIVNNERLRIWPQASLIEDNGTSRKLIKAFNISIMPEWTDYDAYFEDVQFSLVFEGLSRDCQRFKLVEPIPEQGGFFSNRIRRNSTDVYHIRIHCKSGEY